MSSGLDSPLSSLLSSPPASDDEISPPSPVAAAVTKGKGKGVSRMKSAPKKSVKGKQQQKLPFVRKASTPPRKVRKKEPPHVPTLADSPELAFIVMFRSRFSDAFKGVPNLGCQDIERGIVDSTPSEQIEQLLCKLLSLVLNRKKPVERGHNQRALEEAANAHRNQWPASWEGKSPFSGNKSFGDLDTAQRLEILEALIHWSLSSSEVIRGIINDSYKGSRRDDDLNVPLSVQPWGRDADKRRYWLIEGRGTDDTPFRLYRESNPALKTHTWISVAGTIEEIQTVAKELEEEDGSKHALALKEKITGAIPRFEEGETRRKKREYRASRKAFFNQPSGVSLYEGRTRGKRIRYNFSTDEEGGKETSEPDDNRSRRSARSNKGSPAPHPQPQPLAPIFTASGRQIRKPVTGDYGEVKINGSNGTATGGRGTPFGSENGDYNNRGLPFVGVVVYKGDDKDDNEGDDEREESEDEAGWGSGPDEAEDKDAPRRSLKIVFKIPKAPGSADDASLAAGNNGVVSPSKVHQIVRVAGGEPTPIHTPVPQGNGVKSNGIRKKDTEDITMNDIEPIKEVNPAVNGAKPPVDQRKGLSA
ncbi:unnamed protein product [Tuber aestivum]|uniref:WHIM1 domain-containing protein n=1 Tax=Tuber aestivum TaxID=59557 RepID=A0A292PWZ3_9PEZI|nr:unnamed protein product [Tuber aestivum]